MAEYVSMVNGKDKDYEITFRTRNRAEHGEIEDACRVIIDRNCGHKAPDLEAEHWKDSALIAQYADENHRLIKENKELKECLLSLTKKIVLGR